jgi:NADPH:quinone reductase-like Zn-dependent oxidoreductase
MDPMGDGADRMHAVVSPRYGPPEVLELRELPIPEPRPGDVRIRVAATVVTSSDCYLRGLRMSPSYRLLARLVVGWNRPRRPVLGMVASGRVHSVGPGVTRFAVGDAVLGMERRPCSCRASAART